jgi:hypothetical protein
MNKLNFSISENINNHLFSKDNETLYSFLGLNVDDAFVPDRGSLLYQETVVCVSSDNT